MFSRDFPSTILSAEKNQGPLAGVAQELSTDL